MRPDKWTEREELRRPGMRRIFDALKAIKEEQPGLVEEASLAAGELAPRRRRADPRIARTKRGTP
jgi:hypothetical protein